MTSLLSGPGPLRPAPPPSAPALDARLVRTAAPAALRAALWSILGIAVLVVVLWAAEDRGRGPASGAASTAGQLWLLSHGARLSLGGEPVGLVPLGLTVGPLLLCRRAGSRVAAQIPGRRASVTGAAVAAPYAAVALLLALLVGSGSFVALVTAVLGAGLVSFAGAAVGAAHAEGSFARVRDRLPGGVVDAAVGGGAAVGALLAASALLAGISLVLHHATATSLARASEPGAVGGLGLLIAGVALVPDAVVWAASWLAGPGFAVGSGTGVSPFGVHVGPLPGLPLLAALPRGPVPSVVALLVLLTPVACGALGGRVLLRRRPSASWTSVLRDAASCGAAGGVGVGLLAVLSGGPLGSDRLVAVGPSPWRVAVASAVEVALGAALALAEVRARASRSGGAS